MADHGKIEAYRILLLIVHSIVDDPDVVKIEILPGEHGTMFRIKADRRNAAFLLGKQGRTARSIRTVMAAMGTKALWKYFIEIEGDATMGSDSED